MLHQVVYSSGVTILPDAPPEGSIQTATLADNHEDLHVEMSLDFSAAGVTSSGMGVTYSLFIISQREQQQITEWKDATGWTGGAGNNMVNKAIVTGFHCLEKKLFTQILSQSVSKKNDTCQLFCVGRDKKIILSISSGVCNARQCLESQSDNSSSSQFW